MMKNLEIKAYEVDDLEIKDDGIIFTGYVGAFGNVDAYGDVLMKGAAASQVDTVIETRFEHYTLAGVMKIMEEDDRGIKVEGELMPDDMQTESEKLNERLRWLVGKGLKYSMSIGFYAEDFVIMNSSTASQFAEYNGAERLLKKITLVEGTITSRPANKNAIITGFKSLDKTSLSEIDPRELEQQLRDGVPMSASVAKQITGMLKKSAIDEDDESVKQLNQLRDLQSLIKGLSEKL